MTVPGPFGGDSPVGLCLVGPRGSDVALVAMGQRLAAQLA
jgi:Asp-tRNA(Asn)/Glu-tRNA(Gln) amidotransferase A subunit family amidase